MKLKHTGHTQCCVLSPKSGLPCTMAAGHLGPHLVGGPYKPVERFVTKCAYKPCVFHHNSGINPISGQEDEWMECIYCGEIRFIFSLPEAYDMCLGGVLGISPEYYSQALNAIAVACNRENNEQFREEVRAYEKTLPCYLD